MLCYKPNNFLLFDHCSKHNIFVIYEYSPIIDIKLFFFFVSCFIVTEYPFE